jgi:hypothetical protein
MKRLALTALLVLFTACLPALAQQDPVPRPAIPAPPPMVAGSEGEILSEPVCFNVINKAPYTVTGTIGSNVFRNKDGIETYHRGNFRLEQGQQTNFCAAGPFYAGRRLDLTLRSLIPLFSCRTAVTGDIIIYGRHKEEGGTDTWAACLK